MELLQSHTWNVEDGSEEYKGLGWYEYRFPVPIEWEGMTVRIRFEAIYRDATIWLNGNRAGSHFLSGYTPFVIDLSPFIRPGEENMLVASVDNSHRQDALPANNTCWLPAKRLSII
ncbi:sugar-binding domain-containing protein [Paenibacillaceae bacterium WGS1546]|uniref:sugar-binding domain-containing protein n=1 Tax=Cohnella sp. WGS1546 TaxID=3366810 RepID=UPI00372CFD85